MPLLEGYEYPMDDLQPLFELLKEWGLNCLYQTLIGNYLVITKQLILLGKKPTMYLPKIYYLVIFCY